MYSKLLNDIFAGILFYSCLPIPFAYKFDFKRVARVAPLVGIIIGGLLGLGDAVGNYLGMPVLTRSACLVAIWVAITGGLHLDGAMDTADGLAVGDPERRLEVMVDSATGAFGAMAAVVLILLKTMALSDIPDNRLLILIAACGWGRWGQQLAIARYPYLKATGKGAFHKEAIRSLWDVLPGLVLMISFSILVWLWYKNLFLSIAMTLTGIVITAFCGAWFNYKLGGHTGDTYGAVVEWTEAVFLCVMTIVC
ncbi:MAG: adenosylcobinamide-GDP ribazoletransferase [Scytonematopsis contorta HA4267-MV1]|jgi:adenosylcobinamide-GDP ribazoletransferase|nr:adenosylcobinamide-GDP ribazoletransferase [Scytonematopsis contorta HA4267-MV1]